MDEKIKEEIKKIPIQELVKYPEWQELRKSFLNTWNISCEENVKKLIDFIKGASSLRDFYVRSRIVFNYLHGSYFRIHHYKICDKAKKLKEYLYKILH
ncbi:MAG: hypothetical protein QXL51_00655 [Candidatus Aenigmatarchaeota archaeon]